MDKQDIIESVFAVLILGMMLAFMLVLFIYG